MQHKLTACALAAFLVTQPVLAQDVPMTSQQATQLACIGKRIVDAKLSTLMATVYASGKTEGADFDKVSLAMDEAMLACKNQHKWTDVQTNIAAEVSMFQIVLDAYAVRLAAAPGFTDAWFEKLGSVLTATPEADQVILLDGVWRNDQAVLKRFTDRLVAAGLPKDSVILSDAMLVMEAKLIVTYSTMDWVDLQP